MVEPGPSSSMGIVRPHFVGGGDDSESDYSPQSRKRFKKAPRRRRKKKKASLSRGVVRICKPYAPFNSNQFLMEENDPLHFRGDDAAPVSSPPPPSATAPSSAVVAQVPTTTTSELPSSTQQDEPPTGDASPSAQMRELYPSPPRGADGSPRVRHKEPSLTEFCKQQFMGDYRDFSVVRLDNMSKHELVEEYLGLEDQLMQLQRKLKEVSRMDRNRNMIIERDDLRPGELLLNHEAAEKISVFKSEIHTLQLENEQLRLHNDEVRANRPASCNSCSSSSSSSSDYTSSSSSGSDSSSEENDDNNNKNRCEDTIDEGVCPTEETTVNEDTMETAGNTSLQPTHQSKIEINVRPLVVCDKLPLDAGDLMDSGVENIEVHSEDELKECEVRKS